jgi:hypothetical protein
MLARMSNTRNRLLSLSAKMIRTSIVDVAVPGEDPIKVQVRSPSIAQAAKFGTAGGSNDPQKQTQMMAAIIIDCCFDPESGSPIFTDADTDAILATPSDGWVAPLVAAVTELMSAAETASKN